MTHTFNVGDKVYCNGYEGVIREIHEGQLTGMATVHVTGGLTCVGVSELALIKATTPIIPGKFAAECAAWVAANKKG